MPKYKENSNETIMLKYKTLMGQGFISIPDKFANEYGETEIRYSLTNDTNFNCDKIAWQYLLYAFEELQDEGLETREQLAEKTLSNLSEDASSEMVACVVGSCTQELANAVYQIYGKDYMALERVLLDGKEECWNVIMRQAIRNAIYKLAEALDEVGGSELMPEWEDEQ